MLLEMLAHDPIVQAVFVAALFASLCLWMTLRRSVKAQLIERENVKDTRAFEREQWQLKQGAIEHRKTDQ